MGAHDGAVLPAAKQPRQPDFSTNATNGPFTLGHDRYGLGNKLPYGNLPRLILAWVSYRSGADQNLVSWCWVSSLSEFMRTLGIYHNSGGRGGVQTRLRNQMKRLFGCSCFSWSTRTSTAKQM